MTGTDSGERDPSDLRWASTIATSLFERASRQDVPVVREVWVGPDLDICTRYLIGDAKLAMRFVGLAVEPASGLPAGDASRFASDLYHDPHTDPGADAWRDADGYAWWGDEPAGGWATMPERRRLFALP